MRPSLHITSYFWDVSVGGYSGALSTILCSVLEHRPRHLAKLREFVSWFSNPPTPKQNTTKARPNYAPIYLWKVAPPVAVQDLRSKEAAGKGVYRMAVACVPPERWTLI